MGILGGLGLLAGGSFARGVARWRSAWPARESKTHMKYNAPQSRGPRTTATPTRAQDDLESDPWRAGSETRSQIAGIP